MGRPRKVQVEQVKREKMRCSTVDVRETAAKEKSHSSSGDETCVVIDKGGDPVERSSKEKVLRAKMMQVMRARMKRSSVDASKMPGKAKSHSHSGAETFVFMDKPDDSMERQVSDSMKRSSVDAWKREKSQSLSGVGDPMEMSNKKTKPMEMSNKKMKRSGVDARKTAANAKSQSGCGVGDPMERSNKKMKCSGVDARKTAAKVKSQSLCGGGDPKERPSRKKVMPAKMNRCSVDARQTAAKAKSQFRGAEICLVTDNGGDPMVMSSKEQVMRANMAKMEPCSVDASKSAAKAKSHSRSGDKADDPMEMRSKEQVMPAKAKAKLHSRSGAETSVFMDKAGDPLERLSKEQVMPAKMNRCSVDAKKTAAKAKEKLHSRSGGGDQKEMSCKEKVMPAKKMNRCSVDAKKTAEKERSQSCCKAGDQMERSIKEKVMPAKMKCSTVDAMKTAVERSIKEKVMPVNMKCSTAMKTAVERSIKEKAMPVNMKCSTVDAMKTAVERSSKEKVIPTKMNCSTVDATKTAAKVKVKSLSRSGGGDPMKKVIQAKVKRSSVDARKTAAKVKLQSGSGGKLRCGSSEDSCSVNVEEEKLISGFKIGKSNKSGPEYGENLGKRPVSAEYDCKKCSHCGFKSPAGNVVRPETDAAAIKRGISSSLGSPPQIHNISSDSESENENLAREDDEFEFVSESSSSSKDFEDSDDDFYPNKSSQSFRSEKPGPSQVFDRKKVIDVEENDDESEPSESSDDESEPSESSDDESEHSTSDEDFNPNKSSKSFCSEKSGPSQEIEVVENEDEIEYSESAHGMDEDESEHSESAHEMDGDESEHSQSAHEMDEDESEDSESAHEMDEDVSEHSESTHDKDKDDSSSDEDFHPNISSNNLGKKSINKKKEKVKEFGNKERTRAIKADPRSDAERFKGRMKRLPELNNCVPTRLAERLRSSKSCFLKTNPKLDSSQTNKRKNNERETCVITLDDDEQEIGASPCQDGENDMEKTNPQEKEEHEEKGKESIDNEQSDSSSNDNKEDDWRRKHLMPWKKRSVDKILVDSLWDQVDLLTSLCHEQETFPLSNNFSLEDYNAKPAEEKSYWDIEGDKLFEEMYREMDFENATDKIGSTPLNIVGNDQTPKNNYYKGAGMLQNCGHGKHLLVLDEQIGLLCKLCSYVEMEIRYVPPTFVANAWKRTGNKEFRENRNNIHMDQLGEMEFENGRSHPNEDTVDTTGTVWGLIPGMRPTMYSHQRNGFEFIWNNLEGNINLGVLKKETSDGGNGCIISHAPGTGKTRLTIMFVKSYLELYPTRKVVIIAPCNMLLTWEEEFKKWKVNIPFHNLNRQEFSGEEANAAINLIRQFREQDKNSNRLVKLFSWKKDKSVLGMSYRLFEKLAGDDGKKKYHQNEIDHLKLKDMLQKLPDLLVLDEGHTPRNKKSLIWKALSRVETQKRIILSGTPFQNNFIELYNTLCLVRPKFADKFFVEKEHARSGKQDKALNKWVSLTKGVAENNDDRIDEMRNIIYRMAHVYKGDILKEKLPGLRDSLVVLKPTELQKTILNVILKLKNGLTREHGLSLTTVHPSLLIHSELKEKQQFSVFMEQLEDLKLNHEVGVKTKFIIELIRLSDSLNEKVLIFSQYIPPLTLINDQLESYFGWSKGREVLCMDGGKDTKMRQLSINSFNNSDGAVKVMLASTKACSEGISLVGASRVVLLDVVWNPSVERQAISRAYRLGQKKLVYIYHLVAGAAETTKYSRQTQKDRLSKLVFSSANDNNADTREKLFMGTIGEDKVLQVMVQHEKTCLMFEKIINLEKDSSLIDADDGFGCATSD